MRVGFPLVAVLAIALAGCGGDSKKNVAPLPVAQRFLTADDAPGSKPDPVETRQTTRDFNEFLQALSERAIDPDDAEMKAVFKNAGFKSAGVDARFFGKTHPPDNPANSAIPHVFDSEIELASEKGATSALDWLETDSLKPCRESCAVKRSSFDVDDIPDARGVRRVATAEDIKNLGNADQHPFDSYWIGFTVGRVVYTLELHGAPGERITQEKAQEIASAWYDRLTGA